MKLRQPGSRCGLLVGVLLLTAVSAPALRPAEAGRAAQPASAPGWGEVPTHQLIVKYRPAPT